MNGVLVLGAGGHGKVVADVMLCAGVPVLGFLDDNPAMWGTSVLGLPVLGAIDTYPDYRPGGLVLGIGANRVRKAIAERLGQTADVPWSTAIHPGATVASSVRIGSGVVIVAGAVVNVDSVLGDHVIVNTAATVDHDCVIGSYAHLAPGTNLAGGVAIGDGTLVGVGAAVIPLVSIGRWTTIGAGAVVTEDIPDDVTAKGIPARW
jgi:sugar O-acyltransferase (sialic acid O-acetyltransferase NeuD family)